MYLSPPITVVAILALGITATVALVPASPLASADVALSASESTPAGNQIDRTSGPGRKE